MARHGPGTCRSANGRPSCGQKAGSWTARSAVRRAPPARCALATTALLTGVVSAPCSIQTLAVQQQELKVKAEIKMLAKKGDNSTARILARELVRSRKAVDRLHTSKAQLNSVSMQLSNQLGARLPRKPSSTAPLFGRLPRGY